MNPYLEATSQYNDLLWIEDGACRGNPKPFFPDRGQSTIPAKRICYSCPVLDECREFALANPQPGVWGGMSEAERSRERKRRKNG